METLNRKQFYSNIITIALPIAAQSLIASSLNLIDNLMVGSLGEAQLAAVGAGVQIYFVYWMLIFGFNSGTSMFMAQFWGVRDITNIRKTIGFTVKVSVSIACVFFAVAVIFPELLMHAFSEDDEVIALGARYIRIGSPCFLFIGLFEPFVIGLRTTQQPKIPLIISAIALLTNTVLNIMLIFGVGFFPRMETDGAALATVIARAVELILLLYAVFGRKNIIAGKLNEYRHTGRELAVSIIKKAIPTTLNETLWGLGQTTYMAIIGHISVTAYAATQASHTIENLFIMAGFSIGDAALILIGAKLGENKIDIAKEMAGIMVKIAIVVGIAAGILMILASFPIVSLFDFTDLGRSYAKKILLIYGITLPLNLFNGVNVSGILRSGGDTLFAAVTEICTVWLIAVPLAFIGAHIWHLPVYFVILLIRMEDVIKGGIIGARFKSGKWANNVIRNL